MAVNFPDIVTTAKHQNLIRPSSSGLQSLARNEPTTVWISGRKTLPVFDNLHHSRL